MRSSSVMFFLKTKSTGLFFCFATLLLLKPLSVEARPIERLDVRDNESLESLNVKPNVKKLAQFRREEVEVDVVEPVEARETNRPRSYIGIGGNIGLGGDSTQIGDGAFAVLGKGALTEHFALHPAFLFGDKNTLLLPVTYGTPIDISSSKTLHPFVGGGISIKEIFDDFEVNPLVTAGVDVPLIDKVTGTARVNVGFDDDTDVGLLLGIGYGN